MDELGVPIVFVNMTKVFFKGASANVIVNGKAFKALVIKKGVWLGCPFAPPTCS
jgi:hypothetical protein